MPKYRIYFQEVHFGQLITESKDMGEAIEKFHDHINSITSGLEFQDLFTDCEDVEVTEVEEMDSDTEVDF